MFPIKIVIPLIFLIVGVGVAYALLSWDRTPEPRPEPVIIRPEPLPFENEEDGNPILAGPEASEDLSIVTVEPAISVSAADQFSNPAARAAEYKVNSAALKKTVDKYGKERANQCAGEITVRTNDTPLNVRSGPSTANSVIAKAAKDSKQSVLLWAPDEKTQSGRWFLLVDARKKTVKGWVSGEYCDASGVVFPR
jgi:hypothetical protein